MTKTKEIKDMTLGELVYCLASLNDEVLGKLVDENHPLPETWDKYGGIHAYDKKIPKEYEQRRKDLIKKLDRREKLYNG